MTQPYYDVGVSRDANTAVIAVRGEIDLFSAWALDDALTHARRHATRLVVDLSGCTFLDSSGLNALLGADVATRGTDRTIAVVCPPDGAPARLLSLTVPGHFAEHPSRAAALA